MIGGGLGGGLGVAVCEGGRLSEGGGVGVGLVVMRGKRGSFVWVMAVTGGGVGAGGYEGGWRRRKRAAVAPFGAEWLFVGLLG